MEKGRGIIETFIDTDDDTKSFYNYNENELLFTINNSSSSYNSLEKILNRRNAVIIDNTNEFGLLINYLVLSRSKDKILIKFVNRLGRLNELELLKTFEILLETIITRFSSYEVVDYGEKIKGKKLGVVNEEVFK